MALMIWLVSFNCLLLLPNGVVLGSIWFISTGAGTLKNESSTSGVPTYFFDMAALEIRPGRGFSAGRIRAESDHLDASVHYAMITNASELPLAAITVNNTTGDLQIQPYNQHLRFPDTVAFFVKAEEVRGWKNNRSAIVSAKTVAKVILVFRQLSAQSRNGDPIVDLAVPNTALVGDMIGKVGMVSRGGGTTYRIDAISGQEGLEFLPANNSVFKTFEVIPRTGELYVNLFLAGFNQKHINVTVAAHDAQLNSTAETTVRAWIYDTAQPQEVQLALGVASFTLLQYGYANLTAVLTSGFGFPIALGRVSEAGNSDKGERTIVKLVFLDETRSSILNGNKVLSKLDRGTPLFLHMEKLFMVQRIQVVSRIPSGWENLSFPAIILIAICAFLSVCLCLVLGIFCHLKHKFRHGYYHAKKHVPPPVLANLPTYRPKTCGSVTGSSVISHPRYFSAPSVSSSIPTPYIYGSIDRPLGSFRAQPDGNPSKRSKSSPYEEQEMSLSLGSDGISGRRSEVSRKLPNSGRSVSGSERQNLSRKWNTAEEPRHSQLNSRMTFTSEDKWHTATNASTTIDTPSSLERTYF